LAEGSRSGFRPTGVVEGSTSLPVGLHIQRRVMKEQMNRFEERLTRIEVAQRN